MSAATEALAAMIASVQRMETLVADSMPELAKAVQTELERTIAAGTTAYNQPWKPTQSGEPALVHAADALRVMPSGKTIYVTLGGVEARHHFGNVKGKVKREILPVRGLPSSMAKALQAVLERNFQKAAQP